MNENFNIKETKYEGKIWYFTLKQNGEEISTVGFNTIYLNRQDVLAKTIERLLIEIQLKRKFSFDDRIEIDFHEQTKEMTRFSYEPKSN